MQVNDIKRLRAVIYARASRDRRGKARSVGQQIEECRADIADHEDWYEGPVFSDNAISASEFSSKDRPGYTNLVKELREGDVLVVWEASRSSRKMPDFMELRELCTKRGVLWCVAGRVFDMSRPEDRHALTSQINDAELETARMSKRIRRGKRGLAKSGVPDGRVPWGYQKALTDDGIPTYTFDPVCSPFVVDAKNRRLRGESWHTICKAFNERGVKRPKTDLPWKASSLRMQITREVYTGYRSGVRGNWPALITEDELARMLEMGERDTSPKPRGNSADPRFLLSGIATCHTCKGPLYGRCSDGVDGYRCEFGHVTRRAKGIDEFVTGKALKALQDWRFDTLLLDVPVEVDESGEPVGYAVPEQDQDGFAALRSQARALRDRIIELKKLMMTGRLNPDEWVEMRDELEKQAAELDIKAAAELADPLLTALAANPAAVWGEWDMESKRAFLRQVVKKLEVIPQGAGKKARYPDSVVLEIKLPDRAQVAQSVIRTLDKPNT